MSNIVYDTKRASNKKRISIIVPVPKIPGPGNIQTFPRYGPTVIATILQEAGHEVKLYDEAICKNIDLDMIVREADIIGFSSKTGAISKVEEMVNEIRFLQGKHSKYIPIVLGGEHASMAPEHAIDRTGVDYVIKGEGDKAFLDLIRLIETGYVYNGTVEGLTCHREDGSIVNTNRGFSSNFDNPIPNLDLVVGYNDLLNSSLVKHFPFLWSLLHKSTLAISFQGSRGCPYACKFCPTPDYLQGRVYRRRSVDASIRFLKRQMEHTGLRRIVFEDPLGAVSDSHFRQFIDRLVSENLGLTSTILSRIEIYRDKDLLKKMRWAGVKNLSIGIESINEKSLQDYDKRTTVNNTKKAIEIFHKYGFSVTGLFIAGSDSDTVDDIYKIGDFIKELNLEKWRISPLGQVPEKHGQMFAEHRVFTWNEFESFNKRLSDYATGDFVIFFPKLMKPSELQQAIDEVNGQCMSLGSLSTHFLNTFKTRGIQSTIRRYGTRFGYGSLKILALRKVDYLKILREVEEGLYIEADGNNLLDEAELVKCYLEKTSQVALKQVLV